MNDEERLKFKEMENQMTRFELGQDEILLLLRGPLDEPGKGLVAAVRRLEDNQALMQRELERVSSIAHSAPCPFLSGAETSLVDHLEDVKKQTVAREDKKKKLEERTWDVVKPLLIQFLGAVLGGSVIAWVMSLLS